MKSLSRSALLMTTQQKREWEAEILPVFYLLSHIPSVFLSQSGRSDNFLLSIYPERTAFSLIPPSNSHQDTVCASHTLAIIPNIYLYYLKRFPRKSN